MNCLAHDGSELSLPLGSKRILKKPIEITDLSFVKEGNRKCPRIFWNVKTTGDGEKDSELGARLANEYLEYEATKGAGSPILPLIIRSMPRDLTLIEIAFLENIGRAATSGRHTVQHTADFWAAMRARRAA